MVRERKFRVCCPSRRVVFQPCQRGSRFSQPSFSRDYLPMSIASSSSHHVGEKESPIDLLDSSRSKDASIPLLLSELPPSSNDPFKAPSSGDRQRSETRRRSSSRLVKLNPVIERRTKKRVASSLAHFRVCFPSFAERENMLDRCFDLIDPNPRLTQNKV